MGFLLASLSQQFVIMTFGFSQVEGPCDLEELLLHFPVRTQPVDPYLGGQVTEPSGLARDALSAMVGALLEKVVGSHYGA